MVKPVTGQLFVREAVEKSPDGKRIMIVCGILAIPEGFLIGERLYPVFGSAIEGAGLEISVSNYTGVDITEKAKYARPSELLCMPIWRV